MDYMSFSMIKKQNYQKLSNSLNIDKKKISKYEKISRAQKKL